MKYNYATLTSVILDIPSLCTLNTMVKVKYKIITLILLQFFSILFQKYYCH